MGYVTVRALDNFYGNEEKRVITGQSFRTGKGYADDLVKKGLVVIEPAPAAASVDVGEPAPVEAKAAPKPANKMNPNPVNKAA